MNISSELKKKMKIFGFERDNQTLSCSAENLEDVYTSSFELYPFHEGKEFAVYKGLYNGIGPKRGEFCVVKSKLNKKQKLNSWNQITFISAKAQHYSYLFNSYVKHRFISFTSPRQAILETVSDFIPVIRLVKHHENKLKSREIILMEDFIEGKFQRFSTPSGLVNSANCDGILEAFSHFSWNVSREIIISGLQGACQGATYHLTTPTIHSTTGSFGENDRQWPGILEFFASHRCNNICSGWMRPDVPHHLKFYSSTNCCKATAPTPSFSEASSHF
ncbi:hypothetical protein LOTGIDRAFT_170495 [Lottia gigantea]|uniref:Alpha-type protein kinase domain-containing protein n=1 Tax=Lottia gigantea TaxID=225164 RepID=V4B182_LOTGI|nr:hypothetical protein LOTGIDRAFT_170495 [Lottia gigantea]ESO81959.1 hypothetical protein LOTGIDRAFT_170495 [Lottia gigantea]